jgi:hypothetical protein
MLIFVKSNKVFAVKFTPFYDIFSAQKFGIFDYFLYLCNV